MSTENRIAPESLIIGRVVMVCNAKTDNTPVSGTIVATAKGWYNLETEEFGKVSARIGSLSLAPLVIEPTIAPSPDSSVDVEEEGDEEEGVASSKMAKALREARKHYSKTRRPDGSPSADCADMIARALRDMEPLEVAAFADRCLGVPKGTHEAKYGHLNPGQIRMNSGNQVRRAWKNANESGDVDAIRRLEFVLGIDGED